MWKSKKELLKEIESLKERNSVLIKKLGEKDLTPYIFNVTLRSGRSFMVEVKKQVWSYNIELNHANFYDSKYTFEEKVLSKQFVTSTDGQTYLTNEIESFKLQ